LPRRGEVRVATTIFFLTPMHKNYIVPSFFPPVMVGNAAIDGQTDSDKQKSRHPIFLVLGTFSGGKRNVASLIGAMRLHRNRTFTVRFMGGKDEDSNRTLVEALRLTLPDEQDFNKVELITNADSYEFMKQVNSVDVVLPLVDETNFYTVYDFGRKLTSSMSWGIGFQKNMIVYQPLAKTFGIENSSQIWLYESRKAFASMFGNSLDSWHAV